MVSQRRFVSKSLTTAEKNDVVEKYKNGMTMSAIAREYGCHYSTISKMLKRVGVKARE